MSSHTRLNAAQVADLLASGAVKVLDSRDPAAFERDHIAGATRLDSGNLDQLLMSLPKTQPVLLVCYHGNASQTYAQMFADFRFQQVYDLIGGYTAWEAHLAPSAQVAPRSIALSEWLSQHGFALDNINATIANQTTPLMHAARHDELAIVKELIASGADVNARNADGNQALWLACFANALQVIDELVKAGAQLDNQNDNGATCLMYASSAGKHEVVQRLLKAGASIKPRSLDDFSALDMAANVECLHLLRQADLAERRGALAANAANA